MMRILSKYLKSEHGAAALEAALVTPILLLGGFGTIDASFLVLQHHKLETGLSSAASYLSKAVDPQSLETQARRLAATGQIRSGGKPIIANWTQADIAISYKNFANSSVSGTSLYRGGETVKVVNISTSIPYEGLGLIKAMTGGRIVLSGEYEERLSGAS